LTIKIYYTTLLVLSSLPGFTCSLYFILDLCLPACLSLLLLHPVPFDDVTARKVKLLLKLLSVLLLMRVSLYLSLFLSLVHISFFRRWKKRRGVDSSSDVILLYTRKSPLPLPLPLPPNRDYIGHDPTNYSFYCWACPYGTQE
jgi:hypothetical protein